MIVLNFKKKSKKRKIKKLIFSFLLFFLSVFTFSKNTTELYFSEGVVVCGFHTANISISSSENNTLNKVFVKSQTLIYINFNSMNTIEIVNLNSNVKKPSAKTTLVQKTKKNLVTSVKTKKQKKNLQFKCFPFETPFSFVGINKTINAVFFNNLPNKNSAKNNFLFFVYPNNCFINNNKSNLVTVQYQQITNSYLLVFQYTSRPPPFT